VGARSRWRLLTKQLKGGDPMSNDKHKWEFYTDKSGKHRWRRIASNGNIIGASSQGYASPKDAKENARLNGYNG
jgi:uncharacterized protein YegP (UPF0339 family)